MKSIQKTVVCLCYLIAAHWVTLRGAEAPLACVDELAFPVFRPNNAFYLPAEARVSIKIGSDEKQTIVTLSPADTPLRAELLDAFSSKTRYAASCNGKVLSFIVRYVLEGERTLIPVWQVRILAPNEILVISHPMMGGVN